MTRPGFLPIIKFPDDLPGGVMPDPVTVFPVLAPKPRREPEPGCEIAEEFDDQGNNFEICPKTDDGHLWIRGWCHYCHNEEPEKR